MAAKGQSTRDKFFLDFVAAATTSKDPFGKQRQEKMMQTQSKTLEWLPDLLFVEPEFETADAYEAQQAVNDMKALFDQVR